MITENSIALGLIFLRLANILLVQSWFVPDEYWQSMEVAHRLVYGYGNLTWEWIVGIRTYLHPLLIAVIYYFLEILNMSDATMVIYAPRIFQAVFSAFSEFCFYLFIKDSFGRSIAVWSLLSLTVSWFWWFCATRTLINTLEANLVCISLYYFQWTVDPIPNRNFKVFIFIAGLGTIIRPTSLTIWIPLLIYKFNHILNTHNFRSLLLYFSYSVVISFCILATTTIIDRICYGHWVNIHLNFFKFNVIHNQGAFYGSHPWHWYLNQGCIVVLGSHCPLVLYGVYLTIKNRHAHDFYRFKLILYVITFTLVIYSIPGHKEFRFILTLIPFFSIFCAITIISYDAYYQKLFLVYLVITNVPMALYFGLVHQSGPFKVMKYIREDVDLGGGSNSILFLTPCHSTPYYSHIHQNISMKFITCNPIKKKNIFEYGELFNSEPSKWTQDVLFADKSQKCPGNLPNKIVIFDVMLETLRSSLTPCYLKCFETFHTHFPEGKVGRNLIVLCKM